MAYSIWFLLDRVYGNKINDLSFRYAWGFKRKIDLNWGLDANELDYSKLSGVLL